MLIIIKMIKTGKKLNIQAHRCFGSESPANSLEAFKNALKSGIKSLETDVYLSKDNVPYIIHGDTDYSRFECRLLEDPKAPWEHHRVGECTSTFIDTVTYRRSEGHKICRLSELLQVFKGSNTILNIEIKEFDPRITQIVIDAFEKEQMLHQLFFSSFFYYHKKYLKEYLILKKLPRVEFGFLTFSVNKVASEEVLSLTEPGDAITISHFVLKHSLHLYPELYRKAVERGLKLNTWFDGIVSDDRETLESYKELLDLGIDTVITNHPTKAKKLVEQLSLPR